MPTIKLTGSTGELLFDVTADWDTLSYALVRAVHPRELPGSCCIYVDTQANIGLAVRVPSNNFAELAIGLCEAREQIDAVRRNSIQRRLANCIVRNRLGADHP